MSKRSKAGNGSGGGTYARHSGAHGDRGLSGTGLEGDELQAKSAEDFGVKKPEPIPDPALEVVAAPVEPETPPAEPEETPAVEPDPTPEPPVEPAAAPVEPAPETPPVAEAAEPTPPAEESVEDKQTGMVGALSKLRSRNADLERELALARTAPATPQAPPPAVMPPSGANRVELAYDDDGKMMLPDPDDPNFRAYLQRAVAPSPADKAKAQAVADQQDFEAHRAAFVAKDERRGPVTERVFQAARMLDMRASQIIGQTGQKPDGPVAEAQFLEQYGIADEFRQYVPEVTAEMMPDFMDAIFHGSNRTRTRYMESLCAQILPPKDKAPAATVQPLPAEIPPRLAAEGTPNLGRSGAPGKAEQLAALSKQKGENPFGFTKEQNEEMKTLTAELNIPM